MIEWLLKKDILPDVFIRYGVRQITKKRMNRVNRMGVAEKENFLMNFVEKRSKGPIAINTSDANEQHYEMPSDFFDLVLGPHKKYSCAYWTEGDTMADAEENMLNIVCQRAELKDGQKILDLGCG